MLGLKRGTVKLFPHEEAWEREAERTIARLRLLLDDLAADMQHVGSTSIPGIMAKPIVDIAVAAEDFGAVLARRVRMEEAGFFLRPTSIKNQLLFACGSYYTGEGEDQTHFIHVVEAGGPDWRDYLNFRDYLRTFPEEAGAYEALKLRLAAEHPEDAGREKYLAGKHAFIRETIEKANRWAARLAQPNAAGTEGRMRDPAAAGP